MKRLVLAATLALFAIAPLGAPSVRAQEDVEATTVDELVVKAVQPGPAWWRVSDGDTTVWVLGVPDALPKGLKWDQALLKRRLKGANTVITPPVLRASANPLAIPKVLKAYNEASKSKTPPEAKLSADLRARYLRAVVKAGKTAKTYKELRVWFAGIKLAGDYRKKVRLDYAEPMKSIGKAVKASKVKAVPAMAEDMKVIKLLDALKATPDAAGVDCLEDVLAEIEAGDARVKRAAQAWAVGDVGGALGFPRSMERCWAVLPGAARMKRDALEAQADAIERALKKPGHAVAILSIRSIVAKEGVLQRLKARGYEIKAPNTAG